MSRQQAIEFLTKCPVKFAQMVGFNRLTELHNEWLVDMVYEKKDESLEAHRESYKTTCVSVALALIIIIFPNLRTLFMRKTDSDVKEVIKQVANILRHPVTVYFVRCIYGIDLKIVTLSQTEISTNLTTDIKGTAQLVGIGTSSSLTGKHFDRIFTDDIINVQDRISRAERERIKIVYQELQNIRNRGGRIFNTLTPWHKDDASSLMPSPKIYDCYHTGLMTDEQIQQKKDSMSPSLFSANYELKHIASEDVIFANAQIGADISMVEQGNCHIDASYGGADGTAFTICRKYDGKYYVLGKLYHKHIDDCMNEIISLRKSLNAGRISCEDNGDKGYLAKALRQKGERTHIYHENMNKYIKITSYLKAEWKNVIFVNGTDEEYIEQILDYNENAEHDDAPDSCACIIRELWRKQSSADRDTTNLYL